MSNYTIEQLQLAYDRGAELEFEVYDRLLKKHWILVPFSENHALTKDREYRLKNPEKDEILTKFYLYPFDLNRALAGIELQYSDEDTDGWKSVDRAPCDYSGYEDFREKPKEVEKIVWFVEFMSLESIRVSVFDSEEDALFFCAESLQDGDLLK